MGAPDEVEVPQEAVGDGVAPAAGGAHAAHELRGGGKGSEEGACRLHEQGLVRGVACRLQNICVLTTVREKQGG